MSPTGRLLVQENPDPTPLKNFRQGNYKWHSSRVTRLDYLRFVSISNPQI